MPPPPPPTLVARGMSHVLPPSHHAQMLDSLPGGREAPLRFAGAPVWDDIGHRLERRGRFRAFIRAYKSECGLLSSLTLPLGNNLRPFEFAPALVNSVLGFTIRSAGLPTSDLGAEYIDTLHRELTYHVPRLSVRGRTPKLLIVEDDIDVAVGSMWTDGIHFHTSAEDFIEHSDAAKRVLSIVTARQLMWGVTVRGLHDALAVLDAYDRDSGPDWISVGPMFDVPLNAVAPATSNRHSRDDERAELRARVASSSRAERLRLSRALRTPSLLSDLDALDEDEAEGGVCAAGGAGASLGGAHPMGGEGSEDSSKIGKAAYASSIAPSVGFATPHRYASSAVDIDAAATATVVAEGRGGVLQRQPQQWVSYKDLASIVGTVARSQHHGHTAVLAFGGIHDEVSAELVKRCGADGVVLGRALQGVDAEATAVRGRAYHSVFNPIADDAVRGYTRGRMYAALTPAASLRREPGTPNPDGFAPRMRTRGPNVSGSANGTAGDGKGSDRGEGHLANTQRLQARSDPNFDGFVERSGTKPIAKNVRATHVDDPYTWSAYGYGSPPHALGGRGEQPRERLSPEELRREGTKRERRVVAGKAALYANRSRQAALERPVQPTLWEGTEPLVGQVTKKGVRSPV